LTLLFSTDNGYLFLPGGERAKGNQDGPCKNLPTVSDTYKSGGLGMCITAGGYGRKRPGGGFEPESFGRHPE
jgi:hypothetical protein